MKTSICDLAHSKGVPIAVTKAMLAMQERIAELEGAPSVQPAPRPWVGLTEKERLAIMRRLSGTERGLAVLIEAKLKEKNA